jgi:hypothetical protein
MSRVKNEVKLKVARTQLQLRGTGIFDRLGNFFVSGSLVNKETQIFREPRQYKN